MELGLSLRFWLHKCCLWLGVVVGSIGFLLCVVSLCLSISQSIFLTSCLFFLICILLSLSFR